MWGSDPRFSDGVDYRFVRGDGKDFPVERRCLIPADAIDMKVGEKRFRATLDSGSWFYLAGIWEPGVEGGINFRIVTIYAGADIVDYQQRHGAIIHRRQVYQWLDGLVPAAELLCPPPARTFDVERIGGRKPRRQGELLL